MPVVGCAMVSSPDLACLLKTVSDSHNEMVQCLVLKILKGQSESMSVGDSRIVIEAAMEWMAVDHLELAETSSSLVLSALQSQSLLLQEGLLSLITLSKKYSSDSVVLLRYSQVISKLCAVNEEYCDMVRDTGGVDLILSQCHSSDILHCMVAMEMLTDLCATRSGLALLVEQGHVRWLTRLACGDSSSEGGGGEAMQPDPLTGGQALRLLCVVFEKSSELHYPIWQTSSSSSSPPGSDVSTGLGLNQVFLRAVLSHVESTDEASLLIGLQAVSSFATSSPRAAQCVLQDRDLTHSWLSLLGRKVELQAAALHTLARVLDAREDMEREIEVEMGGAVTYLKKELFVAAGKVRHQDTLSYLLKLAKEPVLPLKHAAYDVLRAVARQPSGWGLRLLFQPHTDEDTPWSFLRDVGAEYDKKAKEWKFSVIEAIGKCPQLELLGDEVKKDVQKRLKDGPFFAHARLAEMQTMEL
eukprot:CAMPEP_0182422648 /NCGR_PEP_ID=MMETSP1167-20130531/8385_1 /TAXON_ID=2988 /ORGANISM="Mallomonas Sp, Strain CCMP3275" /LENGTH=469 /DNA_ID=CAMNT_0024600869 /DNA_START=237 /DNA_END=1646 /DNA_ORIENTATION=+